MKEVNKMNKIKIRNKFKDKLIENKVSFLSKLQIINL